MELCSVLHIAQSPFKLNSITKCSSVILYLYYSISMNNKDSNNYYLSPIYNVYKNTSSVDLHQINKNKNKNKNNFISE